MAAPAGFRAPALQFLGRCRGLSHSHESSTWFHRKWRPKNPLLHSLFVQWWFHSHFAAVDQDRRVPIGTNKKSPTKCLAVEFCPCPGLVQDQRRRVPIQQRLRPVAWPSRLTDHAITWLRTLGMAQSQAKPAQIGHYRTVVQ